MGERDQFNDIFLVLRSNDDLYDIPVGPEVPFQCEQDRKGASSPRVWYDAMMARFRFFYHRDTGCKPLLDINIIDQGDNRAYLLKPCSRIPEKLSTFLRRTDCTDYG